MKQYEVADGWKQLEKDIDDNPVEGVYCREEKVAKSAENQEFRVLKDNKVSVLETVAKADMNGLTEATYPTLTVQAFACQYYKTNGVPFEVAEAWANAPKD